MEGKNQHFSHSHNLNLHQIPEGTAITCSGCNSSGTATVYACWQCNFFLHEQCYRASRSFKHPSHPAHPLTLVPYPTYPSNSFYCDSCNQIGTGLSYTCANCEFDLHVQCAYNISKPTLLTPPNHIDHHQNLSLPTHTPSFTPHRAFPNQCFQHETLPSFNHQNAYMPYDQAPTLIPNSSPNQETAQSFNPQHASKPHQHISNNLNPNYPRITDPIPSFNAQNFHITNNIPIPNFPPRAETFQNINPSAESTPNADQPTQVKTGGPMHFSHPHSLRVMNLKDGEDSVACSGCKDIISDSGYACPESSCNFHLDKSCFGLAQEILHKSHPHHPLTLHSSSSDEHGIFICCACFTDCESFTYHCASCKFHLHVKCASLPETVKRNDHEHTLNLAYSCPVATDEGYAFFCDVCGEVVQENCWTYCCGECDYGTHVGCVNCEVSEAEESSSLTLNPILDSQMQILQAQMQLQNLQLQMEGGRQRAQLMMQMGQSSFTGI